MKRIVGKPDPILIKCRYSNNFKVRKWLRSEFPLMIFENKNTNLGEYLGVLTQPRTLEDATMISLYKLRLEQDELDI